MQRYNPKEIEPKWQAIWDETGVYTTDLASDKPKYMAMSMFNYPSGNLHIGHAMNFTISDVKARFKRQQGFETYHPVGWDSFGLPAENRAIKEGMSPQQSMAQLIPDYHTAYKAMGWSNDWEKEIATHLPEYYKWTQWIFVKMFEKGLAYQDSRMQWWCEKDNTVLANEQIVDGKCWRHDGVDDPLVEKKEVKQWFFKITEYADELLDATDSLDWTESVKLAQKNWIGKSQGAEIDFRIVASVNYVGLHGFTSTSQSDFWPWLKNQLGSDKTTILDLPSTDSPDAKDQADYVLGHAKFDSETVVISHSYGVVSSLRLIEQLQQPIIRLVLVAGFAEPGFLDRERVFESTTDWNIDFEKVKHNAKEIILLRAENDSAVPRERADYLRSKLDAKLVDFVATDDHVTGLIEPVVLAHASPSIRVFTTRPDTLFGATFLVLAPEHELLPHIVSDNCRSNVESYVKATQLKSELERQASKQKTGVFTGAYAVNPINGAKIPIWIADYVLAGYGTGAIMAVPAHDERDQEFAELYNLPIIEVVADGKLSNSAEFDGLSPSEARTAIVERLAAQGVASEKINYKMRDWSVSRQRYWGAPIPIIDCPKCGPVSVPETDLPVILPELDDFQPAGDGRSALARAADWLAVNCPQCGGPAERETDTLDTYICSSWYMFRYLDPHNQQQIFDSETINKWMPVDFYNGGDHATAHLLYARFVARFFSHLGITNNPEPFKQMLFNGKVTAADGTMFSKSKGNGIDPLAIIAQGYGADALRTYLMFAAPLELWAKWDVNGVPGTHRFLSRIWNLVQEYNASPSGEIDETQRKDILRATHFAIRKITDDLETNAYNTAIAAAMTLVNELYKLKVVGLAKNKVWQEALEAIVACVGPFAPHIAEELWHQLGHSSSVHVDSWPKFDEQYLVSDTLTIVVQVNGKLRATIEVASDAAETTIMAAAREDIRLAAYLNGKTIHKSIYVPNKLVNFVVSN
jgi:leucyl-tRNA synthetase